MHICKVYGLPSRPDAAHFFPKLEQSIRAVVAQVPRVGGLVAERKMQVFFPKDHLQFSENSTIVVEVDLDHHHATTYDVQNLCTMLTVGLQAVFRRAPVMCRVRIDGRGAVSTSSPPAEEPSRLAVAS